jgi:hypothetical protein
MMKWSSKNIPKKSKNTKKTNKKKHKKHKTKLKCENFNKKWKLIKQQDKNNTNYKHWKQDMKISGKTKLETFKTTKYKKKYKKNKKILKRTKKCRPLF